jgi:hypothetical protein
MVRRVSPELCPCGTSAPKPPCSDGLARLRAPMSLAILTKVERPESCEKCPGPRRVYRLTPGDPAGLGQPCGRAIPPRRWECSTGVEGPLGESRGLSSEAHAVSGQGDPRSRTERTGSPAMPTRPERARRAAQEGIPSRRARASLPPQDPINDSASLAVYDDPRGSFKKFNHPDPF